MTEFEYGVQPQVKVDLFVDLSFVSNGAIHKNGAT